MSGMNQPALSYSGRRGIFPNEQSDLLVSLTHCSLSLQYRDNESLKQIDMKYLGRATVPAPPTRAIDDFRPYNFVCSICQKAFTSRWFMDRHTRSHLGIRPFRCALCNMAFSQKAHVVHHLKRRHLMVDEDTHKYVVQVGSTKSMRPRESDASGAVDESQI